MPSHAQRSPHRSQPHRLARLVIAAATFLRAGALVAAEHLPPPVVTSFQINRGAESVPASTPAVELHHSVSGMRPSEYRVSHLSDFSDASWRPYVEVPTMQNWLGRTRGACGERANSRTVVLFFQVRADLGAQVRVIDGQRTVVPQRVESNVVRDSICALDGP